MRPLLIGLVFAALTASPSFCTTIIVLWTPTRTIIGADAKIRFGNGKSAGRACKIGTSKNILWAHSGIRGVRGAPNLFPNILSEELTSFGSLNLRITRIESRIKSVLLSFFNLPLIKPEVLAHPDKNRVQFVVIALKNGVTRMIVRDFFPKNGSFGNVEIEIKRDSCPDSPDCGTNQYEGLGFHEEADRIVKTDPTIWSKSPQDMIQHLIGTEIKLRSEDVGEPTAIVGLDASGTHWISKGACDDK